MIAATDENWSDLVLQGRGLVLVDFWATWCAPCRALMPILEELAQEYDGEATFVKVDVDANPAIRDSLEIRSVPTVLIYRDGEVLHRMQGAVSKTRMANLIEGALP